MAVFGFSINGFAEETTSAGAVKDVGTASYVVASISSWILSSVVNLVDFAREFGDNILTLTAVTVGWQIVLGFTNLGFVLAIIVIAFATIFRMQSYAIKQTLWKLIVAALLVNFSLVIAGAFISVSNNITDIFVKAITGDSLADALGNAMQPQAFWKGPDADPSLTGLVVGGVKYLIEFIISLLFIAILNFLMILAMLSMFIMLLVRAIALVFLLVLSPAIWLLWIFPYTQSHWNKWWSEFIRWNFFAPAVFFFIYLAVKTAANIKEIGSPAVLETGNMGSALLSSDIFQHAANLFVLLALLFGGIYVANKFSIAGGDYGVKIGQGAGKALGGWAGRKGARTAGQVFAGPSLRAQEWAKEGGLRGMVGKANVAVRGRLNRIPVLKNLSQQYRKPSEHRNIAQSIWGGMRDGTGLFKKYKTKAEKEASQSKKQKAMDEYMKIIEEEEKEKGGGKKEEKPKQEEKKA